MEFVPDGSAPPVVLLRGEGWTITCADTGELTGTRLRNATSFVPRWPVIVAYGNDLGDVDVADLVRFHREHGRMATVVVAIPPARPVRLADDHRVLDLGGHPEAWPSLVSTGIFVFEEAAVKKYIPLDGDVMLEAEPIRDMIADGELMAYRHHGIGPVGLGPVGLRPVGPGLVGPAEPSGDFRVAEVSGANLGGLSALTNRELQVATLIGNCLTNRAIARQLSVAEKTVEMHLSNIFGKLAVSSRTELAALMIRTQQA